MVLHQPRQGRTKRKRIHDCCCFYYCYYYSLKFAVRSFLAVWLAGCAESAAAAAAAEE